MSACRCGHAGDEHRDARGDRRCLAPGCDCREFRQSAEFKEVSTRRALEGGGVTPPSQNARARPVAVGVDTLYVAFYAEVPSEIMQRLEAARRDADEVDGEVSIELGGVPYAMQPFGARGYRYVLENEVASVCVAATSSGPSLYVQFRCAVLWELGPLVVYRDMLRWIETTMHNGHDLVRVVSRVDLAADMIGVDPSFGDREAFVTRAVSTGAYWCGDLRWSYDEHKGRWVRDNDGVITRVTKSEIEETFPDQFAGWTHRKFTGFRFGRSKMVFRIYDKIAEVKRSKKTWFEEVWKRNGWDGAAPVWRFEVQFRREAIKELPLENDEGLKIAETDPELLLTCLNSLWDYAVGGGRHAGWIQWKIPDSSEPQPTRWDVRDEWEAVRQVRFEAETRYPAVRARRLRAKADELAAQSAGCFITWAICSGYQRKYLVSALDHFVGALRERLDGRAGFDRLYERRQLRQEAAREADVGWTDYWKRKDLPDRSGRAAAS